MIGLPPKGLPPATPHAPGIPPGESGHKGGSGIGRCPNAAKLSLRRDPDRGVPARISDRATWPRQDAQAIYPHGFRQLANPPFLQTKAFPNPKCVGKGRCPASESPPRGFFIQHLPTHDKPGRTKYIEKKQANQIEELFDKTINIVYDSIGVKAFKLRRAFIAAIFDAVMVGIAKRLEKGVIINYEEIKSYYDKLIINEEFLSATQTATTDEENVKRRINLAIRAFANVT